MVAALDAGTWRTLEDVAGKPAGKPATKAQLAAATTDGSAIGRVIVLTRATVKPTQALQKASVECYTDQTCTHVKPAEAAWTRAQDAQTAMANAAKTLAPTLGAKPPRSSVWDDVLIGASSMPRIGEQTLTVHTTVKTTTKHDATCWPDDTHATCRMTVVHSVVTGGRYTKNGWHYQTETNVAETVTADDSTLHYWNRNMATAWGSFSVTGWADQCMKNCASEQHAVHGIVKIDSYVSTELVTCFATGCTATEDYGSQYVPEDSNVTTYDYPRSAPVVSGSQNGKLCRGSARTGCGLAPEPAVALPLGRR
jgi:hypothetical protein